MRRLAAVVIAPALLVLALAGCTAAAPTASAAGTAWKALPPTGSAEVASDAPQDLPFDQDVPSGLGVRWVDTMGDDPDFTVLDPDDGQGRWSYTHVSTGCGITFYQTVISNIAGVGDERQTSDRVLAKWADADLSVVQQYSTDAGIPLGTSGQGTLDVRTIVSDLTDGSTEVADARAFDSAHAAVLVAVACPAGTDPEAEMAALQQGWIGAALVVG